MNFFKEPELVQELSSITLGKLLQFNNPLFFSMGKLLHMTASDPVKQLQILAHRPLDATYINSTEYQGYEYPTLAEGTVDHLDASHRSGMPHFALVRGKIWTEA